MNRFRQRTKLGKQRSPGELTRVLSLLRAARGEFGRLSRPERTMVIASALGETADFSEHSPGYLDKLKRAIEAERSTASVNDARDRKLFPERICSAAWRRPIPAVAIRSDLIRWLLTCPSAEAFVHARGVRILACRVDGVIDVSGCDIERPLELMACVLRGLFLRDARVRRIVLNGTLLRGDVNSSGVLIADGAEIQGDLAMQHGFRAEGEVRLLGTKITGNLSCPGGCFTNTNGSPLSVDGAGIGGGVFFTAGFRAEGEIRLLGVKITGDLDCSGGSFIDQKGNAISADRAEIGGGAFFMEAFRAEGAVRLPGAKVTGNLSCSGGSFINPKGDALSVDRAEIGGVVIFMDGFRAEGEVRLPGAKIMGNLSCSGGSFINPKGNAISTDGARIGGSIFFRDGFRAEGEVRLLGVKIVGNLSCSGGLFTNPEGNAVSVDRAGIGGGVFFTNGFRAEGEVRLLGVKVAGNLSCSGSFFSNPKGNALSADGAGIGGAVFFTNGFRAEGEVRLLGAKIIDGLNCSGGSFTNPKGHVFSMDRAEIGGSVYFTDGFRAEGEVRLLGVKISGDLCCSGGSIINPNGDAISADGAYIGGAAFFTGGFLAEGEVRLLDAKIADSLDCSGGSFINPKGNAFSAENIEVEGICFLRGIGSVDGVLNFTRAYIGYLWDGSQEGLDWPSEAILTGLRYDGVYPGAPLDAKNRLKWLAISDATCRKKWPDDLPDPQPYRQLAEVLKRQGHDRDARRVMHGFERRHARADIQRAKQNKRRALAAWLRARACICDWVVGYGYNRWLALLWLGGLIVLGAFIFSYQDGRRMQPVHMLALQQFESVHDQHTATQSGNDLAQRYPKFHPVLYSMDALIPLVSFHQEEYWTPRVDPRAEGWRKFASTSWWIKIYHTAHISLGWIIATLFAASFTRLMRSD